MHILEKKLKCNQVHKRYSFCQTSAMSTLYTFLKWLNLQATFDASVNLMHQCILICGNSTMLHSRIDPSAIRAVIEQ